MAGATEVLTIKVGGDVSEALTKLDALGTKVQAFGKSMRRTGYAMTRNFTGPIAAAGAAATAAAVKLGAMGDELLDLEQQTGLSTDSLQEFRRVTTVAGVEQDALAKAAEQMTLRLSRGAEGSADLRSGLEQLGVALRDSSGELRPMSDVVGESVTKLADMEDVTTRNVLATKLFSRGARELAPVLGLGADEISRLREEAHELGLVLDRDALEAGNRFRIQWQTLRQVLGVSVAKLGEAVIPVLSDLTRIIQGLVVPTIQRFIGWLKTWDKTTLQVVAAVGATVAAIGPLVLVGGKLVGVLGLLLSPAGLAVAAIASLATVAITVVKNWDILKMQSSLLWTAIKTAVLDAVGGILSALERMTDWVPIVGDKVAELREEFDAFAEDSLARSGARIAELEGDLNNAAGGMGTFEASTTDAAAALEGLGAAATTAGETATEGVDQVQAALDRHMDRLRQVSAMAELLGSDYDETAERARIFGTTLETLVGAGLDATDERVIRVRDRLLELQAQMEAMTEEAVEDLEEAGSSALELEDALKGTFDEGLDAVIDFATGAEEAIAAFVKNAMKDLAKLLARAALLQALPGVGSLLGVVAGRQHGGPVQRDRPYVVGEAGPELFVPASTGRIVPNNAMGGGPSAGEVAAGILERVGPPPRAMGPQVLARDNYWREVFSEMVRDGRDLGVDI